MMKYTITRKSRKVGWGFTFAPSDPPVKPDHISTVGVVLEKISKDTIWNAHKNCINLQRWFYDGKVIKSVNGDERYNSTPFENLADGDIDTLEIEV